MSDLAIDGEPPVRQTALPPWPYFAEDEVEAVVAVLRSGRVNQWTGNEVRSFEREFAEYVGVPHAIALANGKALNTSRSSLDPPPRIRTMTS